MTQDFDFEAEYQQLLPNQHTRERRNFTRAILLLFCRFKKNGGYDTILKGVSLDMCVPLSKPSLAGNAASISDATIDKVIDIMNVPRAKGTVYLPSAVANFALQAIENGALAAGQSGEILGNPLASPPGGAPVERGSVRKVVFVVSAESHFSVATMDFRGERGAIHIWDSRRVIPSLWWKQLRHNLVAFAEFLASRPEVNLPYLEWTSKVIRRRQTIQLDGAADCGPLAMFAVECVLADSSPEVITDEDGEIESRVEWVEHLRYRYLGVIYYKLTGMTLYGWRSYPIKHFALLRRIDGEEPAATDGTPGIQSQASEQQQLEASEAQLAASRAREQRLQFLRTAKVQDEEDIREAEAKKEEAETRLQRHNREIEELLSQQFDQM